MKEIVKEAQNRFDWWILKTWNVLPTDERYINLTEEQKEFLWENFLLDHPEIQKKLENRFYDPDFDKEWEKLGNGDEEEEKAETSDDFDEAEDDYSELEAVYSDFLASREDLSIPDKLAELRAKQNAPIDMSNVSDDEWEEVDD